MIEQSTGDPTNAISTSFAVDILKHSKQLVLVLRETVTSYTVSKIIENEQHDTLCSALACMSMELGPLDGPMAVIRVDPAPGFVALNEDKAQTDLHLQLEIGRVKNINMNPIAE